MTKKMVRYNGGTESYYGCSDHARLTRGQVYEVTGIRDLKYQTNYILKGVKGEFNSIWFDEAKENHHFRPTFLAVSNKNNIPPKEGESYECSRMEIKDDIMWQLQPVKTSMVKEVEQIGENIYSVTTLNSVYFTVIWPQEIKGPQKLSFTPTYLAVSSKYPEKGKSYECSRMECDGNIWRLNNVLTSTVKDVEQIGPTIYQITTLNSVYITEVR